MVSVSNHATTRNGHAEEPIRSETLAAALYYYDHDCFVVPCCTMNAQGKCSFPHKHDTEKSIGKIPIIGKNWPDARLTREEITHWWTKYPTANVGVLLEPSGLLVIDPDSDSATEEASRLGLPPGPQVRAGRGVHHYLNNPKGIIGLAIKRGESRSIDVLSKGIVIGAGSLHRNGNRYTFLVTWEEWPLEDPPRWAEALLLDSLKNRADTSACPDDLPPIDDLDALQLPAWLHAVILHGHAPGSPPYPSRSEAIWAVVCALVEAGHETATIASILLDSRFAISAKPREQGRKWILDEIGRARAKTASNGATDDTRHKGTAQQDDEPETDEGSEHDTAPPWGTVPEIRITTRLTEMVDEAQHALMQLPGPTLFQRARMLCQIAPAGPSPAWIQRSPNSPIIAPMHITGLREYGARSATWKRYDKRAKTWSAALPPIMIFETLAARVQWRFPHLEGIVDSPTIRPDGTLLATPGYDPATGLFLHSPATAFPAVPEHPSRDDAVAALTVLYEPFADFPFATPASQSAAIAGTLTVVGRYGIRGCTPLFACRAHSKGSGKGLLVNTIAMIGTGRVAPTWTQAFDEGEESKRLLTVAMEGDLVAHIDNVTRPLGNAPLDSAITATSVKGRLLGRNVSQEAPWTTVLFASGNNMTLTSDMARRVVPIDLDPQCEHPEERSNFQHSPLLEWVHRERPRFVVAALTVLRAYFHAGCPKQPDIPEFGSFEQWSNLIRHALVWCGWPDPNDGRKNLESDSDTSYEALATLLQCWGDCYSDGVPRTLKVIIDDCALRHIADPSLINPANEWNALHDALSVYDAKYDGKRLDAKRIGNTLKTIEGRVLDGQRIIRRGETHRVALWKREILK